jgi:hypothetical protein
MMNKHAATDGDSKKCNREQAERSIQSVPAPYPASMGAPSHHTGTLAGYRRRRDATFKLG